MKTIILITLLFGITIADAEPPQVPLAVGQEWCHAERLHEVKITAIDGFHVEFMGDWFGTNVMGESCEMFRRIYTIPDFLLPITNAEPCGKDLELFFGSSLETNWVLLWQANGTNHEAGVVTSNYFADLIFKSKTNRVQLEATKLKLDRLPQREVETPWLGTNWGALKTNLFVTPCQGLPFGVTAGGVILQSTNP